MANINSGYVALAVVGAAFFGLQVWWISMIIKNGKNERVLFKEDRTKEIKTRLEKIFLKTTKED